METIKTEILEAAINALVDKAKTAATAHEAKEFAQAALDITHVATILSNMK